MIYIVVLVVLMGSLLGYFKVADRYNIIDKPNKRSSHSEITIRGGGIVFPVALLLYSLLFQNVPVVLLTGLLLLSVVSFQDDLKSLPGKLRFAFHMMAVSSLLWTVGAFELWPVWLIVLAYIILAGTLNAYNFMDGINGITGLYSLIVLLSLLYQNRYGGAFTDEGFIICPIIACLVFLFYNFRKKAKCFAGDVGSVSIGFWVISLILMLMIETESLKYVLFLAVYGVDAVLTIVHRLLLKQNIFLPHRLHLYQILANEGKVPHLRVASIYGGVQMIINLFIIHTDFGFLPTSILVLVPLALAYVLLKPRWEAKAILG